MSADSITAGRSSGNLNFYTAQKMIHRLLTLDRIITNLDFGMVRNFELYNNEALLVTKAFTKEELAEKLGISSKELDRLRFKNFYNSIAKKISLPLIRLYCATKFQE